MKSCVAVLALAAAALPAAADIAFDNLGPNNEVTGGGWLVRGPGVSPSFTHAFPFTSLASGEITTVSIVIQHLSGSQNSYIVELRADNAGVPGATIATLGEVTGFLGLPVPSQFTAAPGATLAAGASYWLYARGVGDTNGTWRQSLIQGGVRAYSFDFGANWTVAAIGGTSGQGAARIEVETSRGGCYANCDESTAQPVLNVADFTCFLQRFAAGESYANCDESTVEPVLNVADFTCFLQAFAGGCR